MNKLDLILITITMACIAYIVHIWWSRRHNSVISSPIVAIVQIMGILVITKALAEVLDYHFHRYPLDYTHIIFEVAVFSLLCAPLIYLLYVRPLFSEIRENAKISSGIVDNAADGILAVDGHGVIQSLNKAAEAMFGYTPEALIGQNIKMIISDGHGKNGNVLRKLLATGDMSNGDKIIGVTGIRNDGSCMPLDLAVSGYTSNKKPLYTLIIHDLTEHRKSEEFYINLFKNSPIGIYIAQGGAFKFVNPQFQKYTGYSEEELLEKARCMDIVYEEDRELVRENAIKMLKGERTKPYEYRVKIKDGEVKWILETVAPVEFNGERATLGNFMNIDQYKHMEKTLNATNQSLSSRVHELERRNEQIEILNDMSEVVQSCLSVEEACKTIAFYASKLFPTDSGAICLINDSGDLVEQVSSWGKEGLSKQAFALDDCWGLRRGATHVVKYCETELRCEHLAESRPYDYLCIPLISQTNTLGVLFISAYADSVNYLTEKGFKNKTRLAKSVAEYASLALRNIKLQDNLRQRSIRDPLTGLYNRGYMVETLNREIAYAKRANDTVAVMLLDVDHFKKYNDRHGHEAGDAVLTTVAKFLQDNVRSGDVACRYGGEEFLLILPKISLGEAVKRAETLRNDVKNIQLFHAGRMLENITLSIGVAIYPENAESPSALLHVADQALYRAKEDGRDRVVVTVCEEIRKHGIAETGDDFHGNVSYL
jgi:diguanylate cyclase (GGDEF)-like protein/PAS domain S-box-containing protein